MLAGVLQSGRPSSPMYAALQNDMKVLLVDAGELRRLGITVLAATEVLDDSHVIDWGPGWTATGTSEGATLRRTPMPEHGYVTEVNVDPQGSTP